MAVVRTNTMAVTVSTVYDEVLQVSAEPSTTRRSFHSIALLAYDVSFVTLILPTALLTAFSFKAFALVSSYNVLLKVTC